MVRALVTGGCGFIGSHLCEELVKRGYGVTVIDDLSTGRHENIKDLPVDFVEGNVKSLPFIIGACRNMDVVFHLAAMNRALRSIDNPIEANNVNVTGTLNVLMGAKHNGVKRVVYASSSSVYGGGELFVKKEQHKPNPETPYAVGKLTGEYYCHVFQRLYGLQTICLRYFSVYGERQRSDVEYAAVIPKFIDRLKNDLPCVIYGDGSQIRDFTYVKDTVEATVMLAESNETDVFNISCAETVTINRLSSILCELMGKKIPPIYEAERVGEVKCLSADILKIKQLGFVPKYGIRRGLKEMMNG